MSDQLKFAFMPLYNTGLGAQIGTPESLLQRLNRPPRNNMPSYGQGTLDYQRGYVDAMTVWDMRSLRDAGYGPIERDAS